MVQERRRIASPEESDPFARSTRPQGEDMQNADGQPNGAEGAEPDAGHAQSAVRGAAESSLSRLLGTLGLFSTDTPSLTVEEWPHPVEQPLGATVRAHFDRLDYLRANDDAALLAGHFKLAAEVVQEQVGLPGAEDPEHVVLRQHRGMRRATKVDTVGAGFAGVCDGSLSAGRILDAIAQLVGEDPVLLRDRTPAQIRLLVEQGFLEPA